MGITVEANIRFGILLPEFDADGLDLFEYDVSFEREWEQRLIPPSVKNLTLENDEWRAYDILSQMRTRNQQEQELFELYKNKATIYFEEIKKAIDKNPMPVRQEFVGYMDNIYPYFISALGDDGEPLGISAYCDAEVLDLNDLVLTGDQVAQAKKDINLFLTTLGLPASTEEPKWHILPYAG